MLPGWARAPSIQVHSSYVATFPAPRLQKVWRHARLRPSEQFLLVPEGAGATGAHSHVRVRTRRVCWSLEPARSIELRRFSPSGGRMARCGHLCVPVNFGPRVHRQARSPVALGDSRAPPGSSWARPAIMGTMLHSAIPRRREEGETNAVG
ncbi:hypothetical protein BD413DRAFT_286236 [Trametes elegans]|nr:hypothetical protein BD413DRAFT_286236 [Trametes elegans]